MMLPSLGPFLAVPKGTAAFQGIAPAVHDMEVRDLIGAALVQGNDMVDVDIIVVWIDRVFAERTDVVRLLELRENSSAYSCGEASSFWSDEVCWVWEASALDMQEMEVGDFVLSTLTPWNDVLDVRFFLGKNWFAAHGTAAAIVFELLKDLGTHATGEFDFIPVQGSGIGGGFQLLARCLFCWHWESASLSVERPVDHCDGVVCRSIAQATRRSG